MAGVEVVTHAWKEWGLQALVLLSFRLQVTLLVLAEFRRHIDSVVLRAFVWSAYMLADATAIYVLGHLSVISRSPEHELLALWAPFLLLHLGGQDNITAYAIEDNRLWLRHLQTLVVQVAAAAYVIYGSPIIVGDSRSLLLPATILMFVVGVVKCGERAWALRCAGSSPTGNYWGYYWGRRLAPSLSEAPALSSRLDPEGFLLNAQLLLDFAKSGVFHRPSSRLVFYFDPSSWTSSPGSQLRLEEMVYKVAEMQLSLMHDVLYTKAEVTHTWYGLCLRVLSSLATAVAFLLFNILLLGDHHLKLKSYSRVDVVVTYVLFVGAVVLETTSLLRAMFSSWTCALLVKWSADWNRRKGIIVSLGVTVCNFLAHVLVYLRRLVRAADWRRRYSWSRSMGQHNLVQLCTRSRASRSSRIARWMGVEDRWNTSAYSWSFPVSARIEQLLQKRIEQLVQKGFEMDAEAPRVMQGWMQGWNDDAGVDGLAQQARQWGQEALESRGLHGDLAWSVDAVQFKLEERILIWHIATDVYLCWYKDQEQAKAGGSQGRPVDLVEAAQALSNYMLFLLAARPHMLPPDAGRDAYVDLCYGLTGLECSSAEDVLCLLRRYADALRTNPATEFELPCEDTARLELEERYDALRSNKTLKGGCKLGAFLIDQQDSPVGDTLEMVCQVWVEMLCVCSCQAAQQRRRAPHRRCPCRGIHQSIVVIRTDAA